MKSWAQQYHRNFYPVDMNGCKLYLSFDRYGLEVPKIWDISGQGNHGTISGAIPAIRPMLQPVASGSVIQANMKISAVNGTAFVDFSAASVLTDYLNHFLVIKDSSNRVISGYIKAAGTGETLDSELVNNGSFTTGDGTGWTESAGATATENYAGNKLLVTLTSSGDKAYIQNVALTTGALYLRSMTIGDYAAGGRTIGFRFVSQETTHVLGATANGTFTRYTTKTTVTAVAFGNNLDVGLVNGDIFSGTGLSLKQVLTPSASGVVIVSAQGEATYNWLSKDASFNYNDSSGYTYTIYSVPGFTGLGWFGDGVDDRISHSSLNLGTTHTLHYWLLYQGISGVIHGGAANYHGLRLTPTACGYRVGGAEVTVTHSATYGEPVLFSIDRNGTSVDFYKNGIKIGTTQTLGANTAQVLTDLFRYSDGTSYWNGIIFDAVAFNTNKGSGEIRKFFDLTRARYGV